MGKDGSPANREEADARSVFVGNVNILFHCTGDIYDFNLSLSSSFRQICVGIMFKYSSVIDLAVC